MSWKNTGLLLALAALLFAFIFFVERHIRPTNLAGEPPPRLVPIQPLEVTNLVLRRTNQLVLRADRVAQRWQLSFPLTYPAQHIAIERLLQALANLTSQTYLSPQDLAAHQRTVAEFGLDLPQATLLLQHGGRRTELLFGAKTAVGDQVYFQMFNAPGIYVVDADIVDLLPRTANDWRDTTLASISELSPTRIEARIPSRGFAIEVSQSNNLLYLTSPTRARASFDKVQTLLRKIQAAQVHQFVNDDPRAELEPYGFQPPVAELLFGQGTNELLAVQFGKSPAEDPTLVYARRMSQTNVVLVPKAVLEAVQTSHTELRDLHLLSFLPALVDSIEVRGEENFVLRRQTNGLWAVTEPQAALADADLIRDWLNHLALLQGQVEKDVVTDLAAFGLAAPARQYILKSALTNAAGITNYVIAQLDLSAPRQGSKIFARGLDESVYSITSADYAALPAASWQLRDRRVWTFAPSQINRVTFHFEGQLRQLVRSASGEWSFAPGSQGIVSTEMLEKLMKQLGELRANAWVARGEEQRARYGFNPKSQKVLIDLRLSDRPRILTLEFGGQSPARIPFALAAVDGQTWIFEFPVGLFYDLVRFTSNLFLPARTATR